MVFDLMFGGVSTGDNMNTINATINSFLCPVQSIITAPLDNTATTSITSRDTPTTRESRCATSTSPSSTTTSTSTSTLLTAVLEDEEEQEKETDRTIEEMKDINISKTTATNGETNNKIESTSTIESNPTNHDTTRISKFTYNSIIKEKYIKSNNNKNNKSDKQKQQQPIWRKSSCACQF
jgi:hypothetical protein